MKNLSSLAKKMIISMAVIALLGAVLSCIFFGLQTGLGLVWGILIGTALSMFRFLSLEKSVSRSLDMEPEKGKNYAHIKYLMRMGVTIIVFFVVAINHPTINLFGVAYGAVSMQVSAYICAFLIRKEAQSAS